MSKQRIILEGKGSSEMKEGIGMHENSRQEHVLRNPRGYLFRSVGEN